LESCAQPLSLYTARMNILHTIQWLSFNARPCKKLLTIF
jgi:hypothetical protein